MHPFPTLSTTSLPSFSQSLRVVPIDHRYYSASSLLLGHFSSFPFPLGENGTSLYNPAYIIESVTLKVVTDQDPNKENRKITASLYSLPLIQIYRSISLPYALADSNAVEPGKELYIPLLVSDMDTEMAERHLARWGTEELTGGKTAQNSVEVCGRYGEH